MYLFGTILGIWLCGLMVQLVFRYPPLMKLSDTSKWNFSLLSRRTYPVRGKIGFDHSTITSVRLGLHEAKYFAYCATAACLNRFSLLDSNHPRQTYTASLYDK
jgi:hypothetical protein